jgi:hypothetical protein
MPLGSRGAAVIQQRISRSGLVGPPEPHREKKEGWHNERQAGSELHGTKGAEPQQVSFALERLVEEHLKSQQAGCGHKHSH